MSLIQLRSDLTTDLVISSSQAFKHYGLSINELELDADLKVHSQFVGKTANATKHPKVDFVSLKANRSIRRKRPPELRHFVATAELRHILKADADHWTVVQSGRAKATLADAVWQHPKGYEVSIEFDAGSYTVSRIVEKIETWRAEGKKQVWGVCSKKRAEHIRTYLPADLPIHILSYF